MSDDILRLIADLNFVSRLGQLSSLRRASLRRIERELQHIPELRAALTAATKHLQTHPDPAAGEALTRANSALWFE